jgi:catechol 2,3-dioxygenase-like lactoylglutathione lyase family enzyme
MEWKLEVVVVSVTDVDRAKSFYLDKLGFHLDADIQPTETMRMVHMTPPGSSPATTRSRSSPLPQRRDGLAEPDHGQPT